MIQALSNIWIEIDENISWSIVIIVLAAGYFVRGFKIWPDFNKTLKIAIVGGLVSGLFAFIKEDIDAAIWLMSYFCAVGMHTVILKVAEYKIKALLKMD